MNKVVREQAKVALTLQCITPKNDEHLISPYNITS